MPKMFSNVFILTGERESGKTRLLLDILGEYWEKEIDCAGVLSPAVFTGAKKTGIDLLDVRGGECQRLANLRQSFSTGIMTDRWVFESLTMDWGNKVLASAIPCDLLLVDELGPIELDKGLGLQNGIMALNSGEYKAAIVVIRPELLGKAHQLWPGAQLFDLSASHTDASTQLMQILADYLEI